MIVGKVLSPNVVGFLEGICATSDFHYQDGGGGVEYRRVSGIGLKENSDLYRYTHGKLVPDRDQLTGEELLLFSGFIARLLGCYTPSEQHINLSKPLAKLIVQALHEDLNFTFITCEVNYDHGEISGSADLTMLTQNGNYHIVSFFWQVD